MRHSGTFTCSPYTDNGQIDGTPAEIIVASEWSLNTHLEEHHDALYALYIVSRINAYLYAVAYPAYGHSEHVLTFGFGAPIQSVECGGMTAFDVNLNQHRTTRVPKTFLCNSACKKKTY